MSGIRGSTRLTALGGACLVVLLILAATAVGLRLPGLGFLDLSPDRTYLDYQSRYVGGYAPLRDSYVDARLGEAPVGGAQVPLSALRAVPAAFRAVPVAAPQSVTVDHPSTNDDFADAYEIPSVPFSARTTTTDATREDNERGNCSPVGGTVWYRFVPSRDLTLVTDTFGTSYSVALAAYSGSKLSTLEPEGCETSATGNAQVRFYARSGVPYYFQLTGVTGGGALTFNLQPLGSTVRVDGADGGTDNPVDFGGAAISGDGRYVAFVTDAAGSGCGSRESCLFVTDLATGTRTLLLAMRRDPGDDPKDSYLSDIDMSADGRHIAFSSPSDDLDPPDTNGSIGSFDVFVMDRVTRDIERVSVSSSGEEGRTDRTKTTQWGKVPLLHIGGSVAPSISTDGRFVSFVSDADNFDPRASDGLNHVYVRDRLKGRTELVSVDDRGHVVWGGHRWGRGISGDGRFVAFVGPGGVYLRDRGLDRTTYVGAGNAAAPVVSEDGRRLAFVREHDGLRYVFVYDVERRVETLASLASDGTAHGSPSGGNGPGTSTSSRVSLSADGRFVTFESAAPALVPHDTNGVPDVFVHDLENRTTVRVSLTSDGSEFSTDSYYPAMSRDGRVVAFQNDSSARLQYAHVSVVAGRP